MRMYRQLLNFTCCPRNPWVTARGGGEGEGVNWRICCGSTGHFRVPPGLCIKSLIFGTQPASLNYVRLRIEQWLLHPLHVLSRDYCDIRQTLNSTPGPSRPHTMHISTTRAFQEGGQIWEKPRYTVNGVPLTKNSLQAPLVALYYSVEYFHGTYWTILVCFRCSDERRMARVESREKITSGRESKKQAICQLRNGVHIFTVSVFDLLSSLTRSQSCISSSYYAYLIIFL